MKNDDIEKISKPLNKHEFQEPERAFSVEFMPDGRPAPAVMTSDEVAMFLRLSGDGRRTLKYWADTGQLSGIILGRKRRYLLSEVMKFLAQKQAKKYGNNNSD